MSVPVLIITGPVGVGKTTVALMIAELLEQAEIMDRNKVENLLIEIDGKPVSQIAQKILAA